MGAQIAPPPVDGGGGPPHDGDMEQRLAKLETAVGRLETEQHELRSEVRGLGGSMSDVKVVLARMEAKLENVTNLKWQLLAGFIASALAVVATLFAIQQMTVSTFRAAADTVQQHQPAPASAPIIINIPAPVQQPTPAGK